MARHRKHLRKIQSIIDSGLENDLSPTKIVAILRKQKLSYRDTDMYSDIRQAEQKYFKVIESRTKEQTNYEIIKLEPTAFERKNKFYKDVFEPLRKEQKLNGVAMGKLIQKWRFETENVLTLSKTSKMIKEFYDKSFL